MALNSKFKKGKIFKVYSSNLKMSYMDWINNNNWISINRYLVFLNNSSFCNDQSRESREQRWYGVTVKPEFFLLKQQLLNNLCC